jgi:cytochrome c biogenesis protein CcmG/thiol:disulfide interchange protein DsbE
MGNRLIIIVLIIAATLGYAVYQSLVLDKKLASQLVLEKNSVLTTIPDVTYEVYGEEGKKVNLKEMAQKNNVVIHFWATWCAPCEKEFPQLIKLSDMYKTKTDLKFLFVAVNDKAKDLAKFLKKFKQPEMNFVILVDNENSSQKDFGTFRLPETYVFNKKLSLLKKFSGPQDWLSDYFVNFFNGVK